MIFTHYIVRPLAWSYIKYASLPPANSNITVESTINVGTAEKNLF